MKELLLIIAVGAGLAMTMAGTLDDNVMIAVHQIVEWMSGEPQNEEFSAKRIRVGE